MSRDQICQQAAETLRRNVPTLSQVKATVGFDGFVDEIIGVVQVRHDLHRCDLIQTIAEFGQRVMAAAGKSGNYELIVKQMKIGGNGPIMANALGALGLGTTYVGAVGFPTVHPVFHELAERATVIPIGAPGHTDALEFADGKLMLGKYTSEMSDITWDALTKRIGEEKFRGLMNDATLIGMVNWTMIPYMSEIWRRMLESKLPTRDDRRRTLFIDLADPEKRPQDDIREALKLLQQFQAQVDVVLGLNLKEAGQILAALSLPGGPELDEDAIEEGAKLIRRDLNISCVVIHPRGGAAAAIEGKSAVFAGPFVKEPKISTGAGDHFNAGFCLGWVLGMSLEQSLCCGVGTSGYYVRSAQSPTGAQLAEFVTNMPKPE